MARPPGARVRAWSLLGLVITLFLGLAKSGTEEQWLSSTASTSRKPYFWPKFIHQTVPNRANISCEELQLMATWDELNPAGAGYRCGTCMLLCMFSLLAAAGLLLSCSSSQPVWSLHGSKSASCIHTQAGMWCGMMQTSQPLWPPTTHL